MPHLKFSDVVFLIIRNRLLESHLIFDKKTFQYAMSKRTRLFGSLFQSNSYDL